MPQAIHSVSVNGREISSTDGDVKLVEIFDSIQGEGVNCGIPMTFVRFTGCNLACHWCDTPYQRTALTMSVDNLLSNLLARKPSWVLFTGGEPALQNHLTEIVKALRCKGIRTTWESNGMIFNEAVLLLDHVTLSPKRYYDRPESPIPSEKRVHPLIFQHVADKSLIIHEMRFLIDSRESAIDEALVEALDPRCIVLSPLMHDTAPHPNFVSGMGFSSPNGTVDIEALERCMKLVGQYSRAGRNVRLSVQMHKLIGAR